MAIGSLAVGLAVLAGAGPLFNIGDAEAATRIRISRLTPSIGTLPARVTISGTGFTRASRVSLNGQRLRFRVTSGGRITAVVPLGSRGGAFTVSVGSRHATSPFSFTVVKKPINVKRSYGVGDSEIRAAVAAAHSSGRALYFPAATYRFDSTLAMTGITAYGVGRRTVLEATRPLSSAIILRGTGASLHDLKITSPNATSRDNSGAAASVQVADANDFVVQNVTVVRAANSGILVLSSSRGTIAANRVRNTLSDGIHLTDSSHDITVVGNRVRNAGDDLIAVVSYVGRAICARIVITRNDVAGQISGRGISTVGGEDITIRDNKIASTSGAGIYVAAENSWNTLGTSNVRVVRNTVNLADVGGINHGAIHVVGRPAYPVRDTFVSKNVIRNAKYRGIFVGPYTASTVIANNRLSWIAEQGIYVDGGRDVVGRGNNVRNVGSFGFYATAAVAGRLLFTHNALANVNRFAIPWVDVMMVEPNTLLDEGEISYNAYDNSGDYPYDRLVESLDPKVAVFANSRTR